MLYPKIRPVPKKLMTLSGLAFLLAGCAGNLPDVPTALDSDSVETAVTRGDGIDPSVYAGEFAVKAPLTIPSDGADLPVVLYAGMSPESDTNIKIRSFLDLRLIQTKLPDLLSGVVEDGCKRELTVDFTAADAQGEDLRAWGTLDAKFFRCAGEDDDRDARGGQYLSAKIDAFAVASVELVDECAVIRLRDIQLNPKGFLGGIASFLGLTALAQSSVLEKGSAFLEQNPVCPELPKELESMVTRYDSGGPREIGDGGIGSELSGSVDVSAATLIGLLTLVKERQIIEERQ